MTMLPNIEEAMEDARNGKLSPYWQNDLKRECLHGELSAEERLALSELNRILSETPQWSSEEELCHDMRNFLLKAFILCHCIKEQSETRRQWLMSPYIWRTSQKDITANLSLYGTEWILSRVRLTDVIQKHM